MQEMDESVERIKMTGNSLANSGPSTDVIIEIMNQEVQATSMIENIDGNILEKTPALSTEGDIEMVNIIAEDFALTENLVATSEPTTETIAQKADVKIVIRENTFRESTAGIGGIIYQDSKSINVIKNLLATPESSAERVSDSMDHTAGNLKASYVSATEVFTELMDIDENTEIENLVATYGSNSEGISELMDQTTEDISVIENIETTLVPITDEITEIIHKMNQVFGVTKHSDVTPVSCTGNDETCVPKVTATRLKRKRNNQKSKNAHPSIPEMVMDSIVTLNKNSGTSFKEIKINIEENYSIIITPLMKYHVINYLHKWVEIGILEKCGETDAGERFRMRKSEFQSWR